nr:hypothetical protein [Rhizobium sp. ACO-34A]
MVLAIGLKRIFVLTATCAVLASTPLQAGNDRPYRHTRHVSSHHDGGAVIGGNGLPSVVPGLGTFTGSLTAVRVKGTGIYMAIEKWPVNNRTAYQPPKAKIIEIDAETGDAACSFEAGVCVIRPH